MARRHTMTVLEVPVTTPEQRRLNARHAALMSHAKYPAGVRTAQLRRGFEQRFIDRARELHPDASDAEIERVAAILRRDHFTKLSKAAADARARKAGAG